MVREIVGRVRVARRTALVLGVCAAFAAPVTAAAAPEAGPKAGVELLALPAEVGQAAKQLECERINYHLTHVASGLVVQNGLDVRAPEDVKLGRFADSRSQNFRQCRLAGSEGYYFVSRKGDQCLEAPARRGDMVRATQCRDTQLQRFMKFYDEHRDDHDAVQLSPQYSRGEHCLGPRQNRVNSPIESQPCEDRGSNEDQLFEVHGDH